MQPQGGSGEASTQRTAEHELADESRLPSVSKAEDNPEQQARRRSLIIKVLKKLRAKMKRKGKGQAQMQELAGNEEEFLKQKKKEEKEEQRKKDYERLELSRRTKFGIEGGGMHMGG